MSDSARLIPIPGLSDSDVAVISGILKSHGLFSKIVNVMYGDSPGRDVLVWASDIPRVKQALTKYRVRGAGDALVEIPW